MPTQTVTGNLTGAGANSYQEVSQDHSYETDNGYAVMPVAGRTPKFRRIRLHGGIGFRRVKWKSARAGVPPVIPTPTDTNNDLILSSVVTPSLPRLDPQNGGYNWTVEGEYLYVQTTPRTPADNSMPTGGYPFAVAPNDSLAISIIMPIVGSIVSGGLVAARDVTDRAIVAAGNAITTSNYQDDAYRWPFTALAPVFTSSNLIGG